jgi:hypothetical protein
MRSRVVTLSVASAALFLFPAAAQASVSEIGKFDPGLALSCPSSPVTHKCFAFAHATGYQAKVGTKRGLMTVPANGRIVAFTVALGKPGPKQTAFFTDDPAGKLFGEPEIQLTILDPKRKLRSRVAAQSSAFPVRRYFGQTITIALGRSLSVKKGQIVAVTTKTWAPIFAIDLPTDTSWRASREKGTCSDFDQQVAQTDPLQLAQYYCLYRGVRLAYSASFIASPVPNPNTTAKTPAKKKPSTGTTGTTGKTGATKK